MMILPYIGMCKYVASFTHANYLGSEPIYKFNCIAAIEYDYLILIMVVNT